MYYAGIDLHKRTTFVTVMDKNGKLLNQTRVATEKEELERLFNSFPKPIKAALEATRNWYWVYDLVERLVDELKLAHPPKTKLIAETKKKTDKVDSKIIADLLRSDYLPTCYVPDKETRQQRELLRFRAYIVRIRCSIKNRIHIILDKVGIKHPFDDLFTKRGIEFLKELQLEWFYRKELDDCLDILEHLNLKEKEQNKLIEKLCKETPVAKILMSLPGIGYHNALLIASEIGDINRFPDGEHYASYCSLVTTVHISDRTVHYGHITKEGNRWLRWVYIEAAHFARRYSIRFSKLYERIKRRSGPQKAIIAVAREMAVISYYMIKRNQVFRDDKY